MHQEDARKLLIEWMRNPEHLMSNTNYGYEVYLPSLIKVYLIRTGTKPAESEGEMMKVIPAFYAAAWELCTRGI